MLKNYTDKPTIENYLLTDIDSTFNEQVEQWMEDVEVFIDNMTGRNFKADSVASYRVYDGDGTNTLLIDDCVEVTVVKIDDNDPLTVDESGVDDEYFLYPANTLPKVRIKTSGNYFSRGNQNIKVKAKWGYSVTPPADIRNAATILAAGIINYSLNAEGEVKSMSIGRYNVTYKDEKQWQDFDRLQSIYDYYKKYTM